MSTEHLLEETNVTAGVAVDEPVINKRKIDREKVEDRVMEAFEQVFTSRLQEAMNPCKEEDDDDDEGDDEGDEDDEGKDKD